MSAVVWSAIAEERARDALVIKWRREGIGAAWNWQFRLFGVIAGLRRGALTGHAVPELDRIRIGQKTLESWRIIYRVDRSQVVILTIRLPREEPDYQQGDRYHHGE
jgi:plasmid stabilization system protein ParE